jgi:hypothetical protein
MTSSHISGRQRARQPPHARPQGREPRRVLEQSLGFQASAGRLLHRIAVRGPIQYVAR